MESKPIIIIGATGLGKVAYDIFHSNKAVVYCFLDEDAKLHNTEIEEVTVLGSPDEDEFLKYIGDTCSVFIASDENKYKQGLVERIKESRKVSSVNALHSQAYISNTVALGYGNLVAAGAIVNSFAKIGSYVVINAGAVLDYEVSLGNYVQIGAGTVVNAKVSIEDNAFIGSGVTIVSGVKIGKNARVGAGSVVISDVPAGATVFGNPATEIKK